MLHEYPTKNDVQRITKEFPTEGLRVPKFTIQSQTDDDAFIMEMKRIVGDQRLVEWEVNLTNKIYDIYRSYVMLVFYYELGIPDDEWVISPGRNGASIQYFPDFDRRHRFIKNEFDFYSDIFYFKFFSALDVVGHILNEMYLLDLKVEKVDFKKAIEALLKKDDAMQIAKELGLIKQDSIFKDASEIRNSIAHRHPANSLGSGIQKYAENHFGFGGRTYTPSRKIVENINASLTLLVKTIDCLRNCVTSFRENDSVTITL